MTKQSYRLAVGVAALLLMAMAAFPSAPSPGLGLDSGVASDHSSETLTHAPRLELAAAAGYVLDAHHYNLCSTVCFNEKPYAVNLANYLFHADNAWTLSVNEACWFDVAELDQYSERISGYAWTTTRQFHPSCQGPFGNAVLHIGARVGDPGHWQYARQCITANGAYCSDQRDTCIPGGTLNPQECRAMICVKYNVFGLVTAACSSHLENKNLAIAGEQAGHYEFMATHWAAGTFRYLAGDFNLQPAPLDGYWPLYEDLYRDGTRNDAPTFHTRTGLNRKFDYIWVQRGPQIWEKGHLCDGYAATASDHCYTSTRIYF